VLRLRWKWFLITFLTAYTIGISVLLLVWDHSVLRHTDVIPVETKTVVVEHTPIQIAGIVLASLASLFIGSTIVGAIGYAFGKEAE